MISFNTAPVEELSIGHKRGLEVEASGGMTAANHVTENRDPKRQRLKQGKTQVVDIYSGVEAVDDEDYRPFRR